MRRRVRKDDVVFEVETPKGDSIAPCDPDIERQWVLGRELFTECRKTFRALAK